MRTLTFEKERKNWLQRFGKQELLKLEKYFPAINDLDMENFSEAEIGAYLWKYRAKLITIYRDNGLTPIVVRYESLLENPEQVSRELAEQIGLNWHNAMLEHHRHHRGEAHPGGTKGDRALDKTRVSPKLNLNEEEISRINAICNEEMKLYSYK